MNRILTSVVAVALVMSANVFANHGAGHAGSACEAVFGGTAGNSQTMGGFDFGQGQWNAGVNASYFHQFHEMFQGGGQLTANFGDTGAATNSSTMTLGLLVGPTFNFMGTTAGDLSDAMFIFAGAGFNTAKASGVTNTNFQFGAEAGKRFKIWDNITWRPSFSFTKVGSAKPTFAVNVVNFSVLF